MTAPRAQADDRRPQTLDELRAFAAEGAHFCEGPEGFVVLDVKTPHCTGRLFLYGAQVMEWAPTGDAPVLHVSPRCVYRTGKGMRGGIPVCFPWFADRTDDPRPGGAASPNHGFLRTRTWRVDHLASDENGVVHVELSTRDDDATRALWDHAFLACVRVSFGAALSVSFEVSNLESRTFSFEEALHSYFEVGDVERARIAGFDAGPFIDKVDGRRQKPWAGGALPLVGEVDAVFLDHFGTVTIDDAANDRGIRVEKSGSRATVVWTPGEALATSMTDIGADAWRRFVCLETANTLPSAVPLPPAARHKMVQRITVVPRTPLPHL